MNIVLCNSMVILAWKLYSVVYHEDEVRDSSIGTGCSLSCCVKEGLRTRNRHSGDMVLEQGKNLLITEGQHGM